MPRPTISFARGCRHNRIATWLCRSAARKATSAGKSGSISPSTARFPSARRPGCLRNKSTPSVHRSASSKPHFCRTNSSPDIRTSFGRTRNCCGSPRGERRGVEGVSRSRTDGPGPWKRGISTAAGTGAWPRVAPAESGSDEGIEMIITYAVPGIALPELP